MSTLSRPDIEVQRLGFDSFVQERMDWVFTSEYLYRSNNICRKQDYQVGDITLVDENNARLWSGDTKSNGTRLWDDELTRLVWIQSCSKFNIDPFTKVERVYLNQSSTNQIGYWHQDWIDRGEGEDHKKFTMIYYPSINSKMLHQGTEFLVDGEIHEVPYLTGTAVLFRSNIWHRALATLSDLDNRVTLVFHTISIGDKDSDILKTASGVSYD